MDADQSPSNNILSIIDQCGTPNHYLGVSIMPASIPLAVLAQEYFGAGSNTNHA